MITTIKQGTYQLLETRNQTKILILDGKQTFAWVNATGIGEILVTSHKQHDTDTILSFGGYVLFSLKDEPKLTNTQHLELEVGQGKWQGYLLPTGLPNNTDTRNRVIPTDQLVQKVTV